MNVFDTWINTIGIYQLDNIKLSLIASHTKGSFTLFDKWCCRLIRYSRVEQRVGENLVEEIFMWCETWVHYSAAPCQNWERAECKKAAWSFRVVASLLGCDYNLSFLHTATSYGPKVAKAQKRKKPHSDYVFLH